MIRTTKEEQSLTEMLMYAGIPKLPEPYESTSESIKNEDVWVKAIVKIQRQDGGVDYAVAEHDFFSKDEVKIKKSVGGAIIHSILGIYPYDFLKNKNIPQVSNKKEIIDFVFPYVDEDYEYLRSLKKDALKKLFYNVCIKMQIHSKGSEKKAIDYRLYNPKETPKEDGKGQEESNGAGATNGESKPKEDDF